MTKCIVLLKLFAQLGYAVCFVHDGCLIPVDRRIPIGCNTFLWASRASSHDLSAIKQLIKYFRLHATGLTYIYHCLHRQKLSYFDHAYVKKQYL